MNDLLYDSFGSSDIVDPFLEEEEERKRREEAERKKSGESGLALHLDLDPRVQETSDFSEPGVNLQETSDFSEPGVNLIDDIQAGMNEVREEREEAQLDASMDIGLQEDIDALSKNDNVAKELELPMEVVESDPPAAARHLKIKQAKDLMELTPKVKAIMADLEKSRGLADDLSSLTFWEILAQDAQHGFTSGERMAEMQRLGYEAKHTDDPAKRKQYFEEIRSIQAAMAAAPKPRFLLDFFGGHGVIVSAAEQAIVMRELVKEAIPHAIYGAGVGAARGALTGALGGPGGIVAGLGIGATVGFGVGTYKFASEFEESGSYVQLIQDGVDPQVAYNISTGVGMINGLLEVGAFGVLAKPIKDALVKTFMKDAVRSLTDKTVLQGFKAGGKAYLTVMLKEMGIELGQEATTAAGSEIGRVLSGKEAKILSEEGRGEMADQFLEILDKTFKTMIVWGAPGGIITTAAELRDVRKANQAELFMTAIGDSEQASEATEKLPDRKQAAVAEIVKDGPIETVYISANGFQEVFQDGTEAVAEDLGVADQLEDNLGEIDGYLKVPTGVYATKIARDKASHDALSKYTKFDMNDQTKAQMEDHVALKLIEEEKILEASEDRAALEASGALVYNRVKAGLEKSGRWTKESIEQNAVLHRSWAITQGQVMGMTPEEIYDELGVLETEEVISPLEIAQEDWDAGRIPNAEQLVAEGYDAIRVGERTYKLKTVQEDEGTVQTATPKTQTLDQATEAVKAEPGFDAFIEGSQVVDEAGEPLVVYHGTAAKDFKEFNTSPYNQLGSHFGTAEQANTRIEQGRLPLDDEVSEDVLDYTDTRAIPVYLSMKNPLRMEDAGDFSDPGELLEALGNSELDSEAFKEIEEASDNAKDAGMSDISIVQNIRAMIEEEGFDGVVYENLNEGIGESYIAFHPEQIKSIFAEKFDPTSPDILEQEGQGLWDYLYEKNKGEFWRGESKKGAGVGLGALGRGIYVTDKKGMADFFAGQHPSGVVNRYKVKPGLKLIDSLDPEIAKIKKEMGFKPWEYSDSPMYANVLTSDLQKLGYDGVVSSKPAEGIVIFDKKNVELIELSDDQSIMYQAVGGVEDLTPEQEVAFDNQLKKRKDAAEILARLKRLKGTPWANVAIKGVLFREALDLTLAGKELDFESTLTAPSAKDFLDMVKAKGREGIWEYLQARPMIGYAAKPGPIVNSSFIDCKVSPLCAKFCYTAKGRAPIPSNLNKAEMTNWAVTNDPKRAAGMVAGVYKNMAEYAHGKALRLFEKGDISEPWIPFIKELNKLDVRVHVFSKNPDILTKVPDMNLRLLSVDSSNMELAEQNPDHMLAMVYRGKEDLPMVKKYADRIQVLLPVKVGGKTLTREEIAPIPSQVKKGHLCPIDGGYKKIGKFNCGDCDLTGLGCYTGTTTKEVLNRVKAGNVVVDEGYENVLQELLNAVNEESDPQRKRNILKVVDQVTSAIRSGDEILSPEEIGGRLPSADEEVRPGGEQDAEDAEGLQELYQEEIVEEAIPEEEISPTWYYSTLAEEIHTLKPSKAQPKTGQEWMSIISKLPRVKKEEIVWTGLDNFLSMDHQANNIVEAEERLGYLVSSVLPDLPDPDLEQGRAYTLTEGEWVYSENLREKIDLARARLEELRKQKPYRFTHQEIKDYLANGGVRVIDIINGENTDFELRAYRAQVEERAADLEERYVHRELWGEEFEYGTPLSSIGEMHATFGNIDLSLSDWADFILDAKDTAFPEARRFTDTQRAVLLKAKRDYMKNVPPVRAAKKNNAIAYRMERYGVSRREAEKQYTELPAGVFFGSGDTRSVGEVLGVEDSLLFNPPPGGNLIAVTAVNIVDTVVKEIAFRDLITNLMSAEQTRLLSEGVYREQAFEAAKEDIRTELSGELGTRHGRWTLDSRGTDAPGGKNYTELLLSYPDMGAHFKVVPERAKSIRNKLNKWADETGENFRLAAAKEIALAEGRARLASLKDKPPIKPNPAEVLKMKERGTKGYWRYQLANVGSSIDHRLGFPSNLNKAEMMKRIRVAMERAMDNNEAPWKVGDIDVKYGGSLLRWQPRSTLFDALTEEEWAYYSENFRTYFNARAGYDPALEWVTAVPPDFQVSGHFKVPNIIIWLRMTERVGKKYDIAASELDIADQKEIDTMAARRREIKVKIKELVNQGKNLEEAESMEELDVLTIPPGAARTAERKRLRVERSRLANEDITLSNKEHKLNMQISKRRGPGTSKVLLIEESQGDLTKYWRDFRKRQYLEEKEKQQKELIMRQDSLLSPPALLTKKEKEWLTLGRGWERPEQRLPFVDDTKATLALAIKRAIAYAMENGLDRIEWTTGLQQSARYDKSDYLSGLIWNPDTKALKVRQRGESVFTVVATVELEELHKYIGDDSTIKLLAAPDPDMKFSLQIKKLERKVEGLKLKRVAGNKKLIDLELSEEKIWAKSVASKAPSFLADYGPVGYWEVMEQYGGHLNLIKARQGELKQARKILKELSVNLRPDGSILHQNRMDRDRQAEISSLESQIRDLSSSSDLGERMAEISLADLRELIFRGTGKVKLEDIDLNTREGRKIMEAWKGFHTRPLGTRDKRYLHLQASMAEKILKNISKRASRYHELIEELGEYDAEVLKLAEQKKMLKEKDTGAIPGIQPGEKALVGIDLEMSNDEQSDFYDKIFPSVIKKTLQSIGVKNPVIDTGGRTERKSYTSGKQPGFDLDQVTKALTDKEGKTKRLALFQKDKKRKLGAYDLDRRVITLLEDANLSSFLHETGHFFFEATRHLANRPDAPQQIKDDMNALLKFINVSDLTMWNNMSLEERRPGHEQVARAFEVYLFEGRAPVPELMEMFRRFREWLISVYENIKKLDVTLTDDVRNVFDRMLATKEEIEAKQQINGLDPMFTTQPDTMDNATWEAYKATIRQAHDESEEELEARILKNLRWESGAKGRILRQMQREENARRKGVRLEATQKIAEEPVQKAKAFLRQPVEKKKKAKWNPNVVDPVNDSLFTAIAKLGGLIKTEVVRLWGLDPQEKLASGLGAGRRVLRKTGGLDIDRMGEALAEIGYLPVDEHGKYDPHDFEDRFMDELFGNKRYSVQNDEWNIAEAYENFVVSEEGLQPLDESVINGKLSIPIMEELYGLGEDAFWRKLPTGRYGLATIQENGLHPDTVAKKFGFSSGDEMIRALIDAPSMREAVKAETDSRMLELYGDMNTPEQREQAANEAIYNEATTRRVHAELSALSKGMGPGNLLVQEAKAWAEEKISRMTPRNLRPSQYFANERRYNKQAERALAKGDRKEAMGHKRAAVMNYHFARASMKAMEEVDRNVRYFKKFDSKGVQKNVAREQLDQIFAALEKYDLRKSVTQKEIERREDLHEWVAQQAELGLIPSIDPRLLTGKYAPRKHYRDVPMEELRGLYSSIRSIEHLGRLKNKLLVAKGERDLNTAVGKVVKEIIENSSKKKRYTEKETETKREKSKASMRGIFAAHRKFGDILRQFSGWKFGGASFEVIMRPIEERTQWKNEQKIQADMRLSKIFNKYTGRESRHNANTKIYIEGLGESLTKNGMLAIALNWGNPANQQRLIGDPLKGGHGWDRMQIQAVLDQLDQRDWDFVQEIWDFIDEYWKLIEAKEKRISGVAPEKVEAMPINTRFGQYRGGYYPIKYNRKLSREAHKHYIDDFTEDMKRGAFSRAMTKHGFAKERVNEVYSPVRLDLGVIPEHLTEVIHDLAYHEVLVDTGRVLNHPSFRDTVEAYYSFEIWEQLGKAITDMAVGDAPAAHYLEQMLNHVKSGSTIAGLMWNLGTVVLQPLGLTQSMALIGSKWVFKGMARFFVGGAGMEAGLEWVHSVSLFMKNRAININREIAEYQNKITGKRGNVIKEYGFYLMMKAQLIADIPTWLGMYEKVMAEGVDGKMVDEATAIILADRAVKDSQGSGDSIDLAAVQRGSPAWKIFTQFYSFFSVLYQRMHESVHKTKFTNPLSIGRLAADMFLLVSLPVTLEVLMRDIALKGGCDNGDDLECVAEKIKVGHLTYFMGAFIGLREISGSMEGFGYSGPSGSRIFSEAIKLLKQVEQQEWDRALFRSLNQAGGIIFHWPATFNQRIIDALFDVSEGKEVRPTAPLFGQARK